MLVTDLACCQAWVCVRFGVGDNDDKGGTQGVRSASAACGNVRALGSGDTSTSSGGACRLTRAGEAEHESAGQSRAC